MITARCGAHQGGEYKGINTVSSIIDRGELGFGQRNRRREYITSGDWSEVNYSSKGVGDRAYHREANTAGRGV